MGGFPVERPSHRLAWRRKQVNGKNTSKLGAPHSAPGRGFFARSALNEASPLIVNRQPIKDNGAIDVRGLTKRFGAVQAVAGVDFDVREGELFGFLGPNGAGKTTTINMLVGLARPDAGTIRIAGIDCSTRPKAAQHLVGVVPDVSNLYPELTGFSNLCFCGALYGMARRDRQARARELLHAFGLSQAADRKFGGYSKGMKRKLTIAAGILHQPPVLFLDEPTTGIDVASARQIRQLIADLNAKGTTIFLTTHYIEEAQRLCRRIAFIVQGRIVRIDTVENLMRQADGRCAVQFAVSRHGAMLAEAMAAAFPGLECRALGEDAVSVASPESVHVGPLVRFIEDHGAEVFEARRIRPSLEEVFVRVTGIEAAAMRQDAERARVGGDL
ncbi:MAG: ABC transporter ATP-binding protein [Verrucomicrobia bacterium]|nr:ABC transporter ATP-binding protein [Verrucomicrobiota bacterium]